MASDKGDIEADISYEQAGRIKFHSLRFMTREVVDALDAELEAAIWAYAHATAIPEEEFQRAGTESIRAFCNAGCSEDARATFIEEGARAHEVHYEATREARCAYRRAVSEAWKGAGSETG